MMQQQKQQKQLKKGKEEKFSLFLLCTPQQLGAFWTQFEWTVPMHGRVGRVKNFEVMRNGGKKEEEEEEENVRVIRL